MTTQSFSTFLQHTTDAEFRAWGAEFSGYLASSGLVQSADTGQINWTTVTRAGTSANAGYEVWYLNDSLHATAPIYIRFDYGTGTNTSMPRILVTVGTGTNGAGTLTGTALTAATTLASFSGTLPAAATNYPSYMCATSGFFGFGWKLHSASTAFSSMFLVCRTCNASGTPTATGAAVYWGGSIGLTWQCLRFASTAAAYTARTTAATAQFCSVPGTPASSAIGTDFQVFMHWLTSPQVEPVLGVCTVINAELARGVTFAATLVGATSHTYLSMGSATMPPAEPSASANYAFAMIWE